MNKLLKHIKKHIKCYIAGVVLLTIASCAVPNRMIRYPYIYLQKEGQKPEDWKLVWKDDFKGKKLDTSKWSRIPQGNSDWNRHMSMDDRCFELKDGVLRLHGILNPDTSVDKRPFLTGGIWSKGKFAFQYGRIEIRARLGSAKGAWPAIWMLAELERYGKYPRNGEIDIMEHLNFDDVIYQTTHSYYTLNLGEKENPPYYGTAKVNPGEYNVYGISWYPDRIVYQLNGKDTFTYPRVEGENPAQWPFDQPFYILIDQQLGGSWVGEVDPEQLPVTMEIDWVKVYQ